MVSKTEVLRALTEEWGCLPPKENEMVVKEFEAILNQIGMDLHRSTISTKLSNMISKGMLQDRWAQNPGGGSRIKAYSPAEGKEWEDVLQYIKGE